MENYSIISDQIGSGNIGKVYQIQRKEPPFNTLIAKIFEEKGRDQYNNEKEILSILSNSTEPFNECIIKLKRLDISLDFINYFPYNSLFLIFDYLEHGNLSKYLYYQDILPKISEKHIKLICYKLLKALKIIHNNNICHNKIDINNIMFDKEFNPIIIHFSEAGQIYNNNFRKDYQELGKLLAKMMTSGKFRNFKYCKKIRYFEIIKNNKKKYIRDIDFWKMFKETPKEFIDFFDNLVGLEQVNIDELFNNAWLKEIKYKDNYYIDIENDLKKDFGERYNKILDSNEKTVDTNINSIINMDNNLFNNSLTKDLNSDRCTEYKNEEKNLFNLEIKTINNEPKGILFDYIQIIINNNNECNISCIFYNYIFELQLLIKSIDNDKTIKIDYDSKYLEFNATFEENKNNEINETNNEEEIKEIKNGDNCEEDNMIFDEDDNESDNDNEDLMMNIKLIKYSPVNEYDINKEKYYLTFNYIQGDICDYYNYLKIIKEKANSLLKINK